MSAPAADPVSGSVTVSFSAEAGAAYDITVAGRKDHLTGTVGDDGKVTGELWLPDGTYGVNVAVRDKVVGLLVFLGVLTVAAWLLWRHRRRLIVWNARRRERARLQAVERAARVAAQRQAREEQLRQNRLRQAQQDHARRLSEWQRRRDELAALHALAENLRGEETNVTDFRWGRHRAGERVLLVASVSLVEARTRQGVIFTEQTERGEMAVTDRRVLFDGAGKRREWAYDKWLSHEHQEGTGQTMMMVSNRQKSSGVAYSAAEAARVRLVIDLAVASSRGRRAEVVERTRRALSDHDRTRPAAPAGVG